jgi:homogentisate 1,2-dioxygenase
MPGTEAFFSADGDMLIVPQTGDLDVHTELGRVYVLGGCTFDYLRS